MVPKVLPEIETLKAKLKRGAEVLDDLQLGNGASRSEDGLRLLSGISSIEKFDYPE